MLDTIDLSQKLTIKQYERPAQPPSPLEGLHWQSFEESAVVLGFEGWDAAGKGGVIKRRPRCSTARLQRHSSLRRLATKTTPPVALQPSPSEAGHLTVFDRA